MLYFRKDCYALTAEIYNIFKAYNIYATLFFCGMPINRRREGRYSFSPPLMTSTEYVYIPIKDVQFSYFDKKKVADSNTAC